MNMHSTLDDKEIKILSDAINSASFSVYYRDNQETLHMLLKTENVHGMKAALMEDGSFVFLGFVQKHRICLATPFFSK